MKKKSFAAFLAACITVTTVLSPFESVPAFAAQEKEVPAVAAQTEAAETTENTETSETSDDTETTETSDDTEETENTETTEEPEETERTEATETPDATEETESTEEPEDTESTEEDELVGDVDKVSDIINVDVMTSTRRNTVIVMQRQENIQRLPYLFHRIVCTMPIQDFINIMEDIMPVVIHSVPVSGPSCMEKWLRY